LLAERKFQQSFEFTPFVRLGFSTNHYPRSEDGSQAFFRRWLVIPFERTLAPSDQVPRTVLDAELTDPQELSGLLNKALGALERLEQRGRFTEAESLTIALLEFRDQTDPVASWMDRFTILESEATVTKRDLIIAYNAEADRSGRPTSTPKAFTMAVRRLRPGVQEVQREVHGCLQRVYQGLGLLAPRSLRSQISPNAAGDS
jgi:putative DNA primase/helicase